MKGDRIRYRSGYKYQLVNDYRVQLIHIRPDSDIVTEFLELDRTGLLLIKHGYAWDGPSGPTFDTKNFMRGSLVHDALAQLVRDGYLDKDKFFTLMNKELKDICIEDGMSCIRAAWVFAAVEYCGDSWCKPGSDGGKRLITAP